MREKQLLPWKLLLEYRKTARKFLRLFSPRRNFSYSLDDDLHFNLPELWRTLYIIGLSPSIPSFMRQTWPQPILVNFQRVPVFSFAQLSRLLANIYSHFSIFTRSSLRLSSTGESLNRPTRDPLIFLFQVSPFRSIRNCFKHVATYGDSRRYLNAYLYVTWFVLNVLQLLYTYIKFLCTHICP